MTIKNKPNRIWDEVINLIIFTFLRLTSISSFDSYLGWPCLSCLTHRRLFTTSADVKQQRAKDKRTRKTMQTIGLWGGFLLWSVLCLPHQEEAHSFQLAMCGFVKVTLLCQVPRKQNRVRLIKKIYCICVWACEASEKLLFGGEK